MNIGTTFSLQYGGDMVRSNELPSTRNADPVYRLDKLSIEQKIERYDEYGAVAWTLWLENTGDTDTELISELWDCDAFLPLAKNPPHHPAWMVPEGTSRVWRLHGNGVWDRNEWRLEPEWLGTGAAREYASNGGRSSQGDAPFLDLNMGEDGLLVAVGWTGDWRARFDRTDEGARVRVGLKHFAAKLRPGERIRTARVLLLEYHDGQDAAHNRFRRLVREHFSLIGQPGRPERAPLAIMGWGGLESAELIRRVKAFDEAKLGCEYYWVDAGWYGMATDPCPDAFTGAWGQYTGDWRVNPHLHPNGMTDVVEAAEKAGMKFLLWVEPERVIKTTPVAVEHPEYFFRAEGDSWLLDLGDEAALAYITETLCGLIDRLHVQCYRQDFNIDPAPFWRAADEPERAGIREIRFITGLYRLWDTLLERFPALIIDDCSSGGRRVDIEMVSRSVPLWRDDFNCWVDADPEITQGHNSSLMWYLPYHGTALKQAGDTYGVRSCYAASGVVDFWHCGYQPPKPELFGWLRRLLDEFKRVREYVSDDYYTPIPPTTDPTAWCAWQYERPESSEGVVQVFRRTGSPYAETKLTLRGRAADGCVLTDADTGEQIALESGEWTLRLPEPRTAKVYFYTIK